MRFVRKRFGTFEVIDFVAVLIGYALSGEPTLTEYYERLRPFATPFMALFGRSELPHRSTLSRFLAALDQACVEALRAMFLQDALARPGPTKGVGGLWDRQGNRWIVFDLDGTRQAHDVRNEMSNSISAEKYAFLKRKNTWIPHKGDII